MFFEALDLNLIWFLLVGMLLTGYAMLDGFDLGVGILHLLTKTDEHRRLMLNSIGPVWDGNEVWLVTGGGALFAAFPDVYATVFSGFYLPFMILLVMLIFRAVAIEFRSKEPMSWWRQAWDASFSISSATSALLFGVALGNIALGIPLDAQGEFSGTFLSLLNPYALLVGLTTMALFAMHASIYVVMKTDGELQAQARGWIKNTIAFFVICYVTTTMATLLYVPQMTEHVRNQPGFFVLALLNMLAIAAIPRDIYYGRDLRAFAFSCLNIALLMALFGLGVFPYMVPSNPHPEWGLTIYNAASSQKTLGIMLIIAILAIPMVTAYTISIYWIFRGKVKLDAKSY
ncbi:cytochrome d ubiquinol oxidase subunit II [Vampirovibrio chlorellavorus]|uniref:cytochrome d ubiquinol oxidase subunit II n=1 Tax=Vampirovibrio chlorellavorus TaxID=758823 RepID=UPI0026F04650|nr:cytochrome d ubiquinol oxidase subunit II [Vampirovibrio chlorellavorus]